MDAACADQAPHPGHTWGYPARKCPGVAGVVPPRPAARPLPAPTDSTTGMSSGEEGVPVVDLTRLVRDLATEAAQCRIEARRALAQAEAQATNLGRRADYLDSLAIVLAGGAPAA